MQALKEAVTELTDQQVEAFRNEEKLRREMEYRSVRNISGKLSKGQKKRAKRDRRKYGYAS